VPTCSPEASNPTAGSRCASARTPLFDELDRVVREGLGTRYSAAVARVEQRGQVCFERAYGTTRAVAGEPCFVDTRFDLASLTKVFVSTVVLFGAPELPGLDAPLITIVPEWRDDEHAPITLRRILAHDAGFKSGADYRTLLARDVEAFALTEPLAAPVGTEVIYSDLGFIALGTILERAAQRSLAALVEDRLRTWGARATAYRPRADALASIPATETDAWRGSVQGTVHDEKAHLLGGVAGHAGLFGDARDVALLGEWYAGALHGRPSPLAGERVREAVREQADAPLLRRGLGWALKTRDDNSCGRLMSRETFGHTGFTGTSLWVDPVRDCSVTLLTNAVHFGRTDLRELRAAVADAAVADLDAA
jgi:CubicO group peptidase (beta-lactamase class C family)